MPFATGTKFGPYEIQSQLGAGGMGEVYRARDTRLDRTVAIKVLAAHLSSSPELKQRMEREARAISALNHPNICHLYDIGSQDGTDYLVMEFLEGETLADRLRKGAMPVGDVLKIGKAISEALAFAHQHGIIHRDLKPGNIMLTKAGAKLMDFGLAKTAAGGTAGGSGAQSSAPMLSAARTMTEVSPLSPLTTAGTVIGTIQYMAPEQLEGKEADARSDIFAFGAVLYEMLTGKRPFQGKSQLSVASAILEQSPEPISVAQPLAPASLEYVVRTCLAKNPDERFQNAHDVALQLGWIAGSGGSPASVPVETKAASGGRWAWLLSAALAIALVAVGVVRLSSRGAKKTSYFAAPLSFEAQDVAISPNGHTVVIVGHEESERSNVLWVYEPGSEEATRIPNTEGADFPFWSADGRSLGFFADGKLKRLDLAGGPVQTLCDAPTGRGGTWNQNGDIIFTPAGLLGVGLYRIAASGGTPIQIAAPDRNEKEDSLRWPFFLPDGVHYLFSAINLSGRKDLYAIYVGAMGSNERHLMMRAQGNVKYVDPGYLLFYRDRTLFAEHFDLKNFKLTGEAVPIFTDIGFSPRISKAVYSASGNGLLVAQKAGEAAGSQLVWFDRKGHEVGVATKPGVYGNIAISPSGRFVASDTTDQVSLNTDIYTYDVDSGEVKRLTFDPAIDSMPNWSPDEKQVVFSDNREPNFNLYVKNSDGAQEEREIPQDGPDRFATDWSHDGKQILYERGADFWYVSVPEMKAAEFLKTGASLRTGRFSPDGKWVAYASNESGKWEIYVTSFPDAHGKWQISNGGGTQPRWRGDGKELFYLSPDDKIMSVPLKAGANFDPGTPTVLFQAYPRETVAATSEQSFYDVTRDGQKFLINTQVKSAKTPMSIVLNWASKVNN
jgi:eukaryotic-like serine/threonine-protein kinase